MYRFFRSLERILLRWISVGGMEFWHFMNLFYNRAFEHWPSIRKETTAINFCKNANIGTWKDSCKTLAVQPK